MPVTVTLQAVVDYMSKLNVVGWTVGPRGKLYVLLERKPPKLEQVGWEEAHKRVLSAWTKAELLNIGSPVVSCVWKDPDLSGKPIFATAASASSWNFVSKIAAVGKMDLLGDKRIVGNMKRIRDEVRLARKLSARPRTDSQEAAARGEIRTLIQRCKQKFGLGRARLLEVVQEEVDLAMVEDVMRS